MPITWSEVTAFLMALAALITVGISVYKGRKERNKTEADTTETLTRAAQNVVNLYGMSLTEVKNQVVALATEITNLKNDKRLLQDQIDSQDVKLNNQAAEIVTVKRDNRILRRWIEELCEQIRAKGDEPIKCPED